MPTGVLASAVTELATDVVTSANLFLSRGYRDDGGEPAALLDGAIAGPVSALAGAPQTTPGTGVLAHDFADDWYNRVHVIPQAIDFGNLQSTQVEEFLVWNAFFDERELTSSTFDAPPGLSLDVPDSAEPLPYGIKPLEELTFALTGTTAGPPTISGTIVLLIDGVEYEISITGRRIILFPFPPNWKSAALDETYEFKSWVQRSGDGSAQSGSIWGNHPRRRFDYTATLKREHAQRLDNILFGWQTRFYGIIHWAEKSKLAADALAGSASLQLDTTSMSLQEGGTVVLYLDADTNESREVESFTATSITLTTVLQRDWPAGSRVYPSFVATINPSTGGTRLTDGVVLIPVSFECEPSVTEPNTADDGLALTYRGEELYLGRVDWKAGLPFNFESQGQKIDFGSGKFRLASFVDYALYSRGHNWQIKNKAQADAFRAWLGRREGVARPVYMPSGNMDFTLVAPAVNPASSMDVTENEYGSLLALNPARRDVLVLLRDGTYYARRITDVTAVSATVHRLFFDTPIAADIGLQDVKRISFLGLYRQGGNAATIRWMTDEVGTAQMQMQNEVAP